VVILEVKLMIIFYIYVYVYKLALSENIVYLISLIIYRFLFL